MMRLLHMTRCGASLGHLAEQAWRAGDNREMAAPSFLDKLCARRDLAARVAGLPRPIVFTNGVFDILHRGHVSYLAQARSLGASLVIGLNSDASARSLGK